MPRRRQCAFLKLTTATGGARSASHQASRALEGSGMQRIAVQGSAQVFDGLDAALRGGSRGECEIPKIPLVVVTRSPARELIAPDLVESLADLRDAADRLDSDEAGGSHQHARRWKSNSPQGGGGLVHVPELSAAPHNVAAGSGRGGSLFSTTCTNGSSRRARDLLTLRSGRPHASNRGRGGEGGGGGGGGGGWWGGGGGGCRTVDSALDLRPCFEG